VFAAENWVDLADQPLPPSRTIGAVSADPAIQEQALARFCSECCSGRHDRNPRS
jgi:hypothetical protein